MGLLGSLKVKGAMKRVNVVLEAGETSSDAEIEPLMWSRSEGNPQAVALLHIRHWKAAVAFAFSLTRDYNDAEDLASHSFLKVLAAINSGKGPTGPFRPYLFRAIRPSVADHWRRRSNEYSVDEIPDEAHEEEGFAWVEAIHERERISKAFSTLPLPWQKVIWHVDVVGLRPRQLAPIMGLRPNAVSALLRRARNGLREAYLRTAGPSHENPYHTRTQTRLQDHPSGGAAQRAGRTALAWISADRVTICGPPR